MSDTDDTYYEVGSVYIPDLINYLVSVVDGVENIGSGVLINVQGRHYVATAKHCMKKSPIVLKSRERLNEDTVSDTQRFRIIQRRAHASLDIGFLEIEDPCCPEVVESQICDDKIEHGVVHVVGFPATLTEWDLRQKQVAMTAGAFGTTLIDETDDYFRFRYPKTGTKFDKHRGWIDTDYPETPHGFSGGGCFGITNGGNSSVGIIEYKLLGIQSAWKKSERWIQVIRIKRWLELLA